MDFENIVTGQYYTGNDNLEGFRNLNRKKGGVIGGGPSGIVQLEDIRQPIGQQRNRTQGRTRMAYNGGGRYTDMWQDMWNRGRGQKGGGEIDPEYYNKGIISGYKPNRPKGPMIGIQQENQSIERIRVKRDPTTVEGGGVFDDEESSFDSIDSDQSDVSEDYIEQLIMVPLDSNQLLAVADINCPVLPYSDLEQMTDLSQLVSTQSPCAFILYEYAKSGGDSPMIEGHWCSVLLFNDDSITFFDSFGGLPDAPLKNVPTSYKQQFGETKRKLVELLKESPYKYIEWNEHKLQDVRAQTCGRWCAFWIKCANQKGLEDTDQFYQLIKNIQKERYPDKSLDYVICALTV